MLTLYLWHGSRIYHNSWRFYTVEHSQQQGLSLVTNNSNVMWRTQTLDLIIHIRPLFVWFQYPQN